MINWAMDRDWIYQTLSVISHRILEMQESTGDKGLKAGMGKALSDISSAKDALIKVSVRQEAINKGLPPADPEGCPF